MNYFELFSTKTNLIIDKVNLEHTFYRLCRCFHPDAGTQKDTDKKQNLFNITEVNKAYEILKDFNKRLDYLLTLRQTDITESDLDKMFLMDILEVNEQIADYQINRDETLKANIEKEVSAREHTAQSAIKELLEKSIFTYTTEELQTLHQFRLQKKYLDRLRSRLNTTSSDF